MSAGDSPDGIKVIETAYHGHLFRSRTEARWAVFFDTFGIAWEYEIEGFQAPDGTRYLPDFWLPDLGRFVEIKPKFEEPQKCEQFASDERPFLLLAGQPKVGGHRCRKYPAEDYCRVACPDGCALAEDRREKGLLWLAGLEGECACCLGTPSTDHDRWPLHDHDLLSAAFAAATSERFGT